MYLPDYLREIYARFASDPKREFAELVISVLFFVALTLAIGLFVTLWSRTGRDWAYLDSHFALNVVSHGAWAVMIFCGMAIRHVRADHKVVALKAFSAGLVVAGFCGLCVLVATN